MCGPSASGKSTYIDGLLEELGDEVLVICPDQIIIDACGGSYDWTWWRAKDAWKKAWVQLEEAMRSRTHRIIIFDALHVTPKSRREMIKHLAEFDSNGKYQSALIMTPPVELEELVRRDAARERGTIGEEVIVKQINNLRKKAPDLSEGWDRIDQL